MYIGIEILRSQLLWRHIPLSLTDPTKMAQDGFTYYNRDHLNGHIIGSHSKTQWIEHYKTLLYGQVSKGLETNKFKNLIGYNRSWPRFRFSHLDRHLDRSCCNSCPQKIGLFLLIIYTKWKNQSTFMRKQVKKTSKRWQIWVLPRKLQAKMKGSK